MKHLKVGAAAVLAALLHVNAFSQDIKNQSICFPPSPPSISPTPSDHPLDPHKSTTYLLPRNMTNDTLWNTTTEASMRDDANLLWLGVSGPAQHVGQMESNVLNNTLWTAIYDRLYEMCGAPDTFVTGCRAPIHRKIHNIMWNDHNNVRTNSHLTLTIVDGFFPSDLEKRKLFFDMIAYVFQSEAQNNCWVDMYAENGRNFCQVGKSVRLVYTERARKMGMEVTVDFNHPTQLLDKYTPCLERTAQDVRGYFDGAIGPALAKHLMEFNGFEMHCEV